jgi:hypothetical protein
MDVPQVRAANDLKIIIFSSFSKRRTENLKHERKIEKKEQACRLTCRVHMTT